jgi:hypothetical protein
MRVGLIAEGRGDLAVLTNVLKGWLDLDLEDVQYLRPEYSLDETDLHGMSEDRFSNWELVKRECIERTRIKEFLESPVDEDRFVVVQIDTAEMELPEYGLKRPTDLSGESYVSAVRALVVEKINEWLDGNFRDRTRHAVTVEETDAWILALFVNRDTCAYRDPKKQLDKSLNKPNTRSDKERKRLFQMKVFGRYHKLSQPLRNRSSLIDCAQRNYSLRLFLDEFGPRQEP